MSKIALTTGITEQDGAYLSEFLFKKGYTLHGLKRRISLFNTDRIDHLYEDPHIDGAKLFLHFWDLTIKGLTVLIQSGVGHNGEIKWDKTMSDDTPRKVMDITKLNQQG